MSRLSLVDLAMVEQEGDQGRISTVLRSMVDVSLLKDFKFMLCKTDVYLFVMPIYLHVRTVQPRYRSSVESESHFAIFLR
jgi:hypothetical protein